MAAAPGLSWRRPLGSAARLLILAYRYSLSAFIGRQCRFLPTCSEYAEEAIARHGVAGGGALAFGRLCRCRPGCEWGFDPVPEELPSGLAWTRPWRYRGPISR